VAEQASPRVAYRGFISYSHRDAVAGAKLHRRLETYKLPKHLIGTETARGIVPERLTPIFRDREELSAGQSLSQQVQEALAASDVLIILCSPNAKASIWVSKEIETFRALHPDRPILAALLEGEPADAFPDALTADGAEPIAADLRKGKDGWRLGQQKLIAGMTGVPLDALVQRDAQRQLRRVTAITVSALIAMLVMGLLLVAALRARSEADRQRTEAEGLVEYMLTDLRDKLKGVGRLDVMTAVNQRAMDHYGKQGDLASLPPESLNRRARILHAMGEDDEKRGDLRLALKKFEEAHRTTAAVLAQKPNDADAIFAHAQSEYWVGYAYQMQKRFPQALAHDKEYGRLARRYSVATGNSRAAQMEIGWSENTIGVLYLNGLKRADLAEVHFQSYVEAFQTLAQSTPDDDKSAYSLSDALAWLADAQAAQEKWAEAKHNRLAQIEILTRLSEADPQNDIYRFATVSAHRSLFRACYRMKDHRCSEAAIQKALREIATNPSRDMKDTKWLTLIVQTKLDLGFLQVAMGRLSGARDSLETVRQLIAANRSHLGKSEGNLSVLESTWEDLRARITTGGRKDG
jgi:tetratricopeptide (TPR) repeat protein